MTTDDGLTEETSKGSGHLLSVFTCESRVTMSINMIKHVLFGKFFKLWGPSNREITSRRSPRLLLVRLSCVLSLPVPTTKSNTSYLYSYSTVQKPNQKTEDRTMAHLVGCSNCANLFVSIFEKNQYQEYVGWDARSAASTAFGYGWRSDGRW